MVKQAAMTYWSFTMPWGQRICYAADTERNLPEIDPFGA
jgi:hypothetical protein